MKINYQNDHQASSDDEECIGSPVGNGWSGNGWSKQIEPCNVPSSKLARRKKTSF
jgi:hypothetical protein